MDLAWPVLWYSSNPTHEAGGVGPGLRAPAQRPFPSPGARGARRWWAQGSACLHGPRQLLWHLQGPPGSPGCGGQPALLGVPHPALQTRGMRRSVQAGERFGSGDEHRPPSLGQKTPQNLFPPL